MTEFAYASKPGGICLMGHVIADYPSPKDARAMIAAMVNGGADVIEIQIPFSEPMADGPIFMEANHLALQQGVKVEHAFALMSEVSVRFPKTKFLFMTYANIIVRIGAKTFVERAAQAGAKGLIVPDLAYDTYPDLYSLCQKYQLSWVPVLSPNIGEQRIKQICEMAQGFVYLSARLGVTGAATEIDSGTTNFCKMAKSYCNKPIALGFGIRTAEQIAALVGIVDYAVIGSQNLVEYRARGSEGLQQLWRSFAKVART